MSNRERVVAVELDGNGEGGHRGLLSSHYTGVENCVIGECSSSALASGGDLSSPTLREHCKLYEHREAIKGKKEDYERSVKTISEGTTSYESDPCTEEEQTTTTASSAIAIGTVDIATSSPNKSISGDGSSIDDSSSFVFRRNDHSFSDSNDNAYFPLTRSQEDVMRTFVRAAKKSDAVTLRRLLVTTQALLQTDQDGYTGLHIVCRENCSAGCVKVVMDLYKEYEKKIRLTISNNSSSSINGASCYDYDNSSRYSSFHQNSDASINMDSKSNSSTFSTTPTSVSSDLSSNNIKKININYSNSSSGRLVLHSSSSILDIQAGDTLRTPLHLAAYKGNAIAVKLCLENGADVDMPTKWNASALHLAASRGNAEVLKDLINHGANVNQITTFGSTPLLASTFNLHSDVVAILLQSNANPNIKNREGYTALHLAVLKSHIGLVRLLLSYKSDLLITNNSSKTVFDILETNNGPHSNAISKLLRDHQDSTTS